MFLDLLRLANLKQNMELYADFHMQTMEHKHQLSTVPLAADVSTVADLSGAQNLTSQQVVRGQRGSNSHLHHHHHHHHHHCKHRLPLTQEPSQQQALQCKPLDLSAKSSKQQVSAVPSRQCSSISSNKCRQQQQIRPTTIRSLELSSETTQGDNILNSSIQLTHPDRKGRLRPISKLITSSTSPSSISHSTSSVSSVESKSNEVISSTNSSPTNSNNNNNSTNLSNSNSTTNSLKNSLSRRQKHKGAKSHLCTQCGRSFSRSDMLTRHSRLHSGLKPYQCSKCKQVFSRSDHLSTHERTHTGEKPYQCQFCAYSACRRDMITRHMRTHTGNGQVRGKSPAKLRRKMNNNSSNNKKEEVDEVGSIWLVANDRLEQDEEDDKVGQEDQEDIFSQPSN